MVLCVDLGQSGTRIRMDGFLLHSTRGKLAGELPLPALRAVFESLEKLTADFVALSCTGFGGEVSDPQPFAELCKEFFDASHTAVIDDGLAGFIGALDGANGVVLTIGGGVVCVGGRDEIFAHRDGLGSTFGDEGGGFWLGKLGITRALAARQHRSNDPGLVEIFASELAAYDELGVKNGAEAATLAITSARTLLAAADAGNSSAVKIREEGAYLLAQTVISTWFGAGGNASEAPEIAITGGPSGNRNYVTSIQENIVKILPSASFVMARGDNLDGAKWISENMRNSTPPLLRWAHEV